jgi:ABC-type antimicrobial peptide transport system permease subunit
VLSFTVDQRQREIALRMAVGAEAGNVRRMVVAQGMRLAAWGLVLGLLAAGLVSRALEAFLYEVEALDLVTYVAAAVGMAAVAAVAAWIPAIRATRVNPQGALKAE